jgi:hypothetical protein
MLSFILCFQPLVWFSGKVIEHICVNGNHGFSNYFLSLQSICQLHTIYCIYNDLVNDWKYGPSNKNILFLNFYTLDTYLHHMLDPSSSKQEVRFSYIAWRKQLLWWQSIESVQYSSALWCSFLSNGPPLFSLLNNLCFCHLVFKNHRVSLCFERKMFLQLFALPLH